jgi:hypothetical protein
MNVADEKLIASKFFTKEDQEAFARFSGDFNPIHMDPIFSRRTIAGQCIVHGIHGFMWALDSLLHKNQIVPSSFAIKFSKPLFMQEELQCFYNDKIQQLTIKKGSISLFEINLKFDSCDILKNTSNLKTKKPLIKPKDREVKDLVNLHSGEVFYRGNKNSATRLFPYISDKYGKEICCEIASISEVVGMHAPGLHSLLLSANISFKTNKSKPSFTVEHIDRRFNLLNIAINSPSLTSNISALLREKPISGPKIINFKEQVHSSEFKSIRALIIGGSRGLGEATAKIIAAGQGESIITYSTGLIDCRKVSQDINDYGAKCSIAMLRIPQDIELLNDLGSFNQVYYFPTPKIFGKRGSEYDAELYNNFHEIYVDSFQKLVNYLDSLRKEISVFYPSSVAIDSPLPELAEYIDAKIAGEALCKEYDNHKKLSIFTSRIPRTRTDQSISLLYTESKSPEQVMLPIVRKMFLFNQLS